MLAARSQSATEAPFAPSGGRAPRAPLPQSPHPRRSVAPSGDPSRTRRRTAYAFGIAAERTACHFLRAGGYDILSVRERTSAGEIDVIAVRDDTVSFVEVKARRRGYDGLEAVTPRKRRRICRAAMSWLESNERYAGHTLRFDILLIWPDAAPEHLENAFEDDLSAFDAW